jgi:dihydrofolate synthase/folylpolyglutamate synthase
MSYLAAIDGLQGLAGELVVRAGAPRREFRLEDMRALLRELGDPQLGFKSVMIAGTNGKGSTAATLASILAAAGYKTGLYTSPHLARVNERVRIQGTTDLGTESKQLGLSSGPGLGSGRKDQSSELEEQCAGFREKALRPGERFADAGVGDFGEISDEAFASAYFRVDEAASRLVRDGRLEQHSSFFETMTALAFLHFAEEAVDIAVLEVGMGGRLDATNVVEPLLSVITDISLDHMEWLGPTIDAIAREKAGILRKDGVMVTLPQHAEANAALGEIAVALGVRGVNAADYIPVYGSEPGGRNRYSLRVLGEVIEIDSPLAGRHQQRNVALAIAAAVELCNSYGYRLTAADVASGVRTTSWPGRLELFSGNGVRADVLLDVAHNPAGAWALRSGVSGILGDEAGRSATLVFGCLKDKALAEMAQILFPLFDRVVLTEVASPRTAPASDLAAAAAATGANAEVADGAEAALRRALAVTPAAGLVVVGGSVYLVGAIREMVARSGGS